MVWFSFSAQGNYFALNFQDYFCISHPSISSLRYQVLDGAEITQLLIAHNYILGKSCLIFCSFTKAYLNELVMVKLVLDFLHAWFHTRIHDYWDCWQIAQYHTVYVLEFFPSPQCCVLWPISVFLSYPFHNQLSLDWDGTHKQFIPNTYFLGIWQQVCELQLKGLFSQGCKFQM